MLRIPLPFYKAIMRGESPVMYCRIDTHMAYRFYSDKELGGIFGASALLADGSVLADGSRLAGAESEAAFDKAARVLDFGSFERTISPVSDDVLTAFQSKQLQHAAIVFDDADNYFSQIIAKEPFLTRPVSIWAGFDDQPQSNHIPLFQGVIMQIDIDQQTMTIEADER